jgi:hypothetical protein
MNWTERESGYEPALRYPVGGEFGAGLPIAYWEVCHAC